MCFFLLTGLISKILTTIILYLIRLLQLNISKTHMFKRLTYSVSKTFLTRFQKVINCKSTKTLQHINYYKMLNLL